MRVGYFGPEGTYTQEALRADTASWAAPVQEVALPTIYDTVMAVSDGRVARALVPIENSVEGSVNATLDALAHDTQRVRIVGEVVMAIRHCLIGRRALALEAIEVVVSHPQANAQCARFIRTRLPRARVVAGSSTADAVRTVAGHDGPWAALGSRTAAEVYGCVVLRDGVEDEPGNATRFVWLARDDAPVPAGLDELDPAQRVHSTAIVFWGAGTERPGWLVACLSELAERGINLTRIESRPRREGLGTYMFFVDLAGRADDPRVRAGLDGIRAHAVQLRVIGSFPAARGVVDRT